MSGKDEKAKSKKTEKAPPAKKAPKPKSARVRPLPVLLETVFTLSRAAIVLGCAAVAFISFASGATLVDIFIRVGATLLGLGGLLWGFTWFLTNGSIEARQAMALKEAEVLKKDAENSTFEVKA